MWVGARPQSSGRKEKQEAEAQRYDDSVDFDFRLRLHRLSSHFVGFTVVFMDYIESTYLVFTFRTSALKDVKTFEVRARLTKPSQSVIVYMTSVGHFARICGQPVISKPIIGYVRWSHNFAFL